MPGSRPAVGQGLVGHPMSEQMRGDSQGFSLGLLPRGLGWPHRAAEEGR